MTDHPNRHDHRLGPAVKEDPPPIVIQRTNYAGVPNRWKVTVGDGHMTYEHDIDWVLMSVRGFMERQLDEEAT